MCAVTDPGVLAATFKLALVVPYFTTELEALSVVQLITAVWLLTDDEILEMTGGVVSAA